MTRRIVASLALWGLLVSSAAAQPWASKMFTATSHDFGNVARGAKAEFRFQFKNLYKEDVHVAAVRSSCGCTTLEITKRDLKTFETSEIVAKFNTSNYLGYRSATVTVTFDKPFYAEVQLQVSGNIRGDLVVSPGFVELGTIDVGQAVQKKVSVSHEGNSNWQITDVRSANASFEVEVVETGRNFGRVTYDLLVKLRPDAPAGYVRDQLYVVTNDARAAQFPIDVEGRVLPSVTISPQLLALGVLAPGQKVTKNVVVRGKQPFKVLDVSCDGDTCFSFALPEAAREVQLIPVTFTAGSEPGKIVRKIRIVTDLPSGGAELNFVAQAEVKAGPEPQTLEPASSLRSPESVGFRGN